MEHRERAFCISYVTRTVQRGVTNMEGEDNKQAPEGDNKGENANDGGQQSDEIKFTPAQQARIDAIVKERVERVKKQTETATARAKADAEAEAAKRNGEWETVAKVHEAKVKELEPVVAERDELTAVVSKLLESKRANLPAHILELLDGQSPVKQLDWLAKNEAALAPPAPGQTKRVPGTPQPDEAKKLSTAEDEKRRAANARRYRNGF